MFEQRCRLKPEWEVFSLSHIAQDTTTLVEAGLDEALHVVNIVLNAHRGFQNAMPYTPRTLQYVGRSAAENSLFCVSAIGPAQLPATVNGLLLGAGIVRIGLEENLYFRQGELATNLQLTERMVRVLREMEYEPATPAEARQMLGQPLRGVAPQPEISLG